MMKRRNHKKGFTLVEAIVAVAILLVGVTAASTASQTGLFSTSIVRDRVTATFLAQEAIEGVRNIKDSNILSLLYSDPNDSSVHWLNGITRVGGSFGGPCGPEGGLPCAYDVLGGFDSAGELVLCSEDGACPVDLYDNGDYVVYRQPAGAGQETNFSRYIYVEETIPDFEAVVTVIVSRPRGPDFRITSIINRAWQ